MATTGEAVQALASAQERLEQARSRWPEVYKVVCSAVNSLDTTRRDFFGEAFDEAFRRHRE